MSKNNKDLYKGIHTKIYDFENNQYREQTYFEWLNELEKTDWDSFMDEYNKLTDGQQADYYAWLAAGKPYHW